MPDLGGGGLAARLGRLLLCALAFAAQPGDGALPTRFHQDVEPSQPLPGLLGSSMNDVVWSGRFLWVATERGLARWNPADGSGLTAEDWVTFTENQGLGQGAVSALDAHGDTVWAATLYDTLISGADAPLQVGSGLSWSTDGGTTWTHLANEALFDTLRPGFEDGPFTNGQNACFGISVEGDTVWAAFFAGSSVRSTDFGQTWERVLPGGEDHIVYNNRDAEARVDSLEEAGADSAAVAAARAEAGRIGVLVLQHRTFSVAAYGDTVWIGTSAGVASSFDFGRTWELHRVRRNASGELLPGSLSADWGLAIEREITADGTSAIWIGANVTSGFGQTAAINYSDDNGRTWTATGPTFAWDFAFTGSDTVWAGTREALLLTPDRGGEWFQVPAEDPFTGDVLQPSFVGVERFALPDGRMSLWAGADNGLGRSVDGGRTWTILSFPIRTRTLDTGEFVGAGLVDVGGVRTYAAPSPFAPSQDQRCRIVYSLAEAARVRVDIYDFASRKVRTLIDDPRAAGNHGESWDGRDDGNDPVGNGIYFFRVETDAGDRAFGNAVVLD